jgi:hypothetical protein
MKGIIDFLFSGNSFGWNIFVSIVLIVISLLLLGGIWFILYSLYGAIGFARAEIQSENGVITNKYYKGESSHTGVGFTTGGQMAVTTTYDDEEYIIEYKSGDDGKKYRIETDDEIYDSVDVGDKVKAYYKISTTTGEFKWMGGFEKLRGKKND